MATTNQFNFEEYNKVMKNANSGLKLFLAEQLLLDVQATYLRFKNPLRNDITDVVDELADIRIKNKKLAAARETTTDGALDNETLPDGAMSQKSTSADAGKVA